MSKFPINARPNNLVMWLSALGLTAALLSLSVYSKIIDRPWVCINARSVAVMLSLLTAGFACYLAAIHLLRRSRFMSLKWIVFFAVLFRVILSASEPLFDDDIYRYIWDGKVTASLHNPYVYSPERVVLPPFDEMAAVQTNPEANGKMETLDELNSLWFNNRAETELFERINYPEVPTIYPPVAQAVFAMAYLLSLDADLMVLTFKLLFVLFDILIVLVVIKLLGKLRLDPRLCLVYAWNPIAIKEIAGTGHMESLPIFLSVSAVYLFVARKEIAAMSLLGLAIASKLYPAVLLPLFAIRLFREDRKKLLLGLIGMAAVVCAVYLPFIGAGSALFAGTRAYAEAWEMNAGIFAGVNWLASCFLGESAGAVARAMCACCLVILIAISALRSAGDMRRFVESAALAIGTAFLLSPVQNPWYLLWVLPFVCVYFRWSWIALSFTSILYYLGYLAIMSPELKLFKVDNPYPLIVAAQYLPFVLFLWLEWKSSKPVLKVMEKDNV